MKNKYKCVDCDIEFIMEGTPKCPQCNKDNTYGKNIKLVEFEQKEDPFGFKILHSLTWLPRNTEIEDIVFDERYDHLDNED